MPADTLHPAGAPHALTLPEILLQILRELDAKSLLQAALVCKAWTWSAIDTLWRECKIPLSMVLAPLMNLPAIILAHSPLEWTECLVPDDVSADCWSRYQSEYAGKVTAVKMDFSSNGCLNGFLETLIAHHGGPICPNLLSLEYEIDGDYEETEEQDYWTPLLRLLVGSDLEEFTLQIGDVTKKVAEDNSQTLARVAPRILDITINNCTDFSFNYAPFTQLQRLAVHGWIDHRSWKSLANCPHLERLVLWEDDSGAQIDPEDYFVTFPCLKSLTVADCCGFRAAAFIVALCKNTVMPALLSLEVGIREADDARRAKMAILESVRGHSPKLKEVYINGRVPGFDDVRVSARGHW